MATKTYEPTDQELTHWVGTWETEDEVNGAGYHFGARTPIPGEVVVTHSHGKLRRGVVVSVGRLNAKVALTTPSAVKESREYNRELNRVAGKAMPFNLVAVALGSAELADGSFQDETAPEYGPAGDTPDRSDEDHGFDTCDGTDHDCENHPAPVHPFGSHPEPNAAMVASDRDGELVEIRAHGPFVEVQVVRGRIVGQVAGQRNTPGFYVVQHEGTGTYQTYDRRVVFQIEADRAESANPTAKPAPAAQATGSEVVATLERIWGAIRANHPDLPAVVIVTGSGFVGPPRWGHFRANGWSERAEQSAAVNLSVGEMFVAGETLTKGAAYTVETMLHEAAHVLAQVRKIQDTSRQGRWHNQRFRSLAEELGLEYPRESAHPQVGFSECLMTPGTREEYAPVIDDLDRAIRLCVSLPEFLATAPEGQGSAGEHIHHGGRRPGRPGGGSTTNNAKAVCGCENPRIIRASRKVLEEAPILCGICREPFEPETTDEDQ